MSEDVNTANMAPDEIRKVLDRVVKLIRLASNNPHEEEARTAALVACRMMTKFKVKVVMGEPRPVTPPRPPAPYRPPHYQPTVEEMMEHLRRQAGGDPARAPDPYYEWWKS